MFFISLFLFLVGCLGDAKQDDSSGELAAVYECATLKDRQICDFDAVDMFGNNPNLSDLYGQPIVLDLSAMWCGPCQDAAANLQDSAHSVPGVTFLTILIEDNTGAPPDATDIESWMNSYGITTEPVWGSSRDLLTSDPLELEDHLFLTGWPTFYFINSAGELQEYMKGYSESMILEKAQALE